MVAALHAHFQPPLPFHPTLPRGKHTLVWADIGELAKLATLQLKGEAHKRFGLIGRVEQHLCGRWRAWKGVAEASEPTRAESVLGEGFPLPSPLLTGTSASLASSA